MSENWNPYKNTKQNKNELKVDETDGARATTNFLENSKNRRDQTVNYKSLQLKAEACETYDVERGNASLEAMLRAMCVRAIDLMLAL